MEKWKDIEGFEGMYQISNHGRVKSLERNVKIRDFTRRIPETLLSLTLDSKGYTKVSLRKNNKTFYKRVHILVANAFLDNAERKHEVNHKDHNKTNNHIKNLEWSTRKENMNHEALSNNKPRSNNKSGLKGVYFDKHSNSWRASISINNTRIFVGSFENKDTAHKMRNKKITELIGVN